MCLIHFALRCSYIAKLIGQIFLGRNLFHASGVRGHHRRDRNTEIEMI